MIYNLSPLFLGLVLIVVSGIKYNQLRKTEEPQTVQIYSVWIIGLLSFLSGAFGASLSMTEFFDLIAKEGEITPERVAIGVKNSYYPLLIGLFLLIVSLILWVILKSLKNRKIVSKNT
jgi:hypothetical protein